MAPVVCRGDLLYIQEGVDPSRSAEVFGQVHSSYSEGVKNHQEPVTDVDEETADQDFSYLYGCLQSGHKVLM